MTRIFLPSMLHSFLPVTFPSSNFLNYFQHLSLLPQKAGRRKQPEHSDITLEILPFVSTIRCKSCPPLCLFLHFLEGHIELFAHPLETMANSPNSFLLTPLSTPHTLVFSAQVLTLRRHDKLWEMKRCKSPHRHSRL